MQVPSPKKLQLPLSLAVGSGLYSTALLADNLLLEIAASILFVVFLALTLLIATKHAAKEQLNPVVPREVFYSVFGVAIGLLIPALVAGKATTFFWAVDSLSTHIPRASAIAGWLNGEGPFPFESAINSQGGITQFFVGLFFWVFGETPAASVLALALFRALTGIVLIKICRENFRTNRLDVIFLAYALYPNALFHTTAYFKEALVHLLVSVTVLLLSRLVRHIANSRISLSELALLSGVFAMLFIERFYLVLLILPLLLLILVYGAFRKSLGVSIAVALLVAGVFSLHPYFRFSTSELIARVQEMREVHKSFPGINVQVNYEIPLWLAFIKSLLTPIWSPSKIEIFRGFSSLITWGSFLGHIYVAGYVLGVFRATRTHGWQHLLVQIPFVIFLVALAYVSPWAGRIRDSFSPLIVIYATYYFVSFFWTDLAAFHRFVVKRPSS